MLPIAQLRPTPALLACAAWTALLVPASALLSEEQSTCIAPNVVVDLGPPVPLPALKQQDVFRGHGANGSRFTLEMLSPGFAVLTWEGTRGTTVSGMLVHLNGHHLEMKDDFELDSSVLFDGERITLDRRCTDVRFHLEQDESGNFVGAWHSDACDSSEKVVLAGPLPTLYEEAGTDDALFRTVPSEFLGHYRDPLVDASRPLSERVFEGRRWRFPSAASAPVFGAGASIDLPPLLPRTLARVVETMKVLDRKTSGRIAD